MAAAAMLKIKKLQYICNGLTDLYEIWYADANGMVAFDNL